METELPDEALRNRLLLDAQKHKSFNSIMFEASVPPPWEMRVKKLHGMATYHESETPPGITLSSNQYQIWSDVLGKPMTRIHTDGTKLDTRVYMGEAEAWKLEDPITGPGTALGLDVAEIYPYAEPGDPPPGETLSYWSNLEWQCTDAARDYWGSFRDMPFHCQQQAFENPNSTVSTFTRVVTPPKKDDKEKPQSPGLHTYYSSADDLLSLGLAKIN